MGKRGEPGAAELLVVLALCTVGCDQFQPDQVAETCVASAMKNGEPYGNARERAIAEAQLRYFCLKAALAP
jgi:hypothetical protein